jgi:hypothetical protein
MYSVRPSPAQYPTHMVTGRSLCGGKEQPDFRIALRRSVAYRLLQPGVAAFVSMKPGRL